MRALLVLLVVVLAIGLAWLLWQMEGTSPPDYDPVVERPSTTGPEPGSDRAPETGTEEVTPEGPGLAPLDVQEGGETHQVEPRPPTMRLAAFHGQALLQRDGDIPRAAATGRIELDVIHSGRRESMTASVAAGRFEIQIPAVGRVRIVGGELEGRAVHFLGVEALFDPQDDDYVLVGQPVPASVVVAIDALSGAPLSGLTLRRGEEATAARLVLEETDLVPGAASGNGDEPPALLEDAASPITLPWIDANRPVWIHVEKAGYAPASVLVEPGREASREVRLWPEAKLTVRIMGPGRERLRAIVLLREESEERSPHAATFGTDAAGVRRDADAIVFEIEGLAALPHRVEAKGYDGKGRAAELGGIRAELGAGRPGLVTLVVEAR